MKYLLIILLLLPLPSFALSQKQLLNERIAMMTIDLSPTQSVKDNCANYVSAVTGVKFPHELWTNDSRIVGKAPEPGDIVLFWLPVEGIWHVGIALTAPINGCFIINSSNMGGSGIRMNKVCYNTPGMLFAGVWPQ